MSRHLAIDHLQLDLRGVSGELIADAVTGLDEALRRRLSERGFRVSEHFDRLSLSLPVIEANGDTTADQLRHLIVDRLCDVIAAPGGRV